LLSTNHGKADSVTDPRKYTDALAAAYLIMVAASHPLFFNMSCLRRALVLKKYLQRRGVNANLEYGIRRDIDSVRLAAHAWISIDGKPVDAYDSTAKYSSFETITRE
jgi:hypothetical protein